MDRSAVLMLVEIHFCGRLLGGWFRACEADGNETILSMIRVSGLDLHSNTMLR